MLRIDQALDHFIAHPPKWLDGEVQSDRDVVCAIRTMDISKCAVLRKWLESYSVLMGYSSERRDRLCEVIFEFAGDPARPLSPLTEDQIVAQFERLRAKLEAVAPPTQSGVRDVTSLCSKALWCCYPNDVPIFDRNARSALAMISRFTDFRAVQNGSEYARFVSLWRQLFRCYEPLFAADTLVETYGFSVRAFDRFLWYLGDPNIR